MEPLIWDISIQGTRPFMGYKIWSQKNVYMIFVFVTYLCWRDTSIQGKRTLFLGPETRVYPPFREHFSTQKVIDHKNLRPLSRIPFFPCPLFFCYCILFVFCLVSTNQHVLSRIHRSILRSHYVMQTDNIAFLFTEYKICNSQKIRETIEVLCNPLFLLNHTF